MPDQPAGQIDRDLIIREKNNLDRIVTTLGLKGMTQGTLYTYTTTNPTRQALFEYDQLVCSICTLKYLRDPQLERNIRRSQNRIETYHQLHAVVAKVGGKKELTGKNDIETDISNQCGRLIQTRSCNTTRRSCRDYWNDWKRKAMPGGLRLWPGYHRLPGSTFC